jgi:hypothetical protein
MPDVTVILTVWKRDHLEEQLEALLRQTHPVAEIWIYHCCQHVFVNYKAIIKNNRVKYQQNTHDLGYFGRFSMALLAATEYVFIMDDDIVPSADWIEVSLMTSKKYNAIVSSTGRIIPKYNYRPEAVTDDQYSRKYFIGGSMNAGNSVYCEKDTPVDFGCTNWFLKRNWLHFFWSLKPFTMETGEDIHLSVSCLLQGGIKTVCPHQDGINTSGNRKGNYGFDHLASWKKHDFLDKREQILKHFIDDCKWVPIGW